MTTMPHVRVERGPGGDLEKCSGQGSNGGHVEDLESAPDRVRTAARDPIRAVRFLIFPRQLPEMDSTRGIEPDFRGAQRM